MGVELKAITVKWDPETIRMADELEEKFSPFVEGRSQLSRLVFKILHRIVTVEGTVAVVTAHLQGLHPVPSSHQKVFEFPARPHETETAGVHAAEGQPRLTLTSRLTSYCRGRRAAVGLVQAFGPPFSGNVFMARRLSV